MARKRANGEGSIRKRSNGTWEARVTVGVNPETGKIITKSIYGRTQKEVREKLNALQEANEPQAVDPPADAPSSAAQTEADTPEEMTVGEWLDTWLAEYLADVKQGTYNCYESLVRCHIKPAFGELHLSELRPPMIQKFYNQLRTEGLSPKSIKNIHGCFHRALDMAVRIEYLSKNPTSFCVIPRFGKQDAGLHREHVRGGN